MSDLSPDSRRLVVNPSASPDAIRRLLHVLVDDEPTPAEDLFPGGPRTGECRICGRYLDLTEEHLPPRGAFNRSRLRDVDVDDLLGRDDLDEPEGGRWQQGGMRGYTLCEACNHPRWAREYQEWAQRASSLISRQPQRPDEIDEAPGYPAFPDVTFLGVYPGRLIRQVVAMMLTISGSAALATRLPVLRDLALGGPEAALPEPLRIYFLLYGSLNARIVGGPNGQALGDLVTGEVRRVLSVDFPPLAFVMLVDGPSIPDLGVDITEFAFYPVDRRSDVRFEGLPLGFGHKPWPCDYRTKGQMSRDGEEPDA